MHVLVFKRKSINIYCPMSLRPQRLIYYKQENSICSSFTRNFFHNVRSILEYGVG